jgi:hypothetical protein
VSPALLIADLGMPSRFLNMLRVFKIQSPMSMGSWTLFIFSTSSAAAAFLSANGCGNRTRPIRAISGVSQFISLLSGASLASYTGVLYRCDSNSRLERKRHNASPSFRRLRDGSGGGHAGAPQPPDVCFERDRDRSGRK